MVMTFPLGTQLYVLVRQFAKQTMLNRIVLIIHHDFLRCRRLKKDAVPTIPSKNLPMKRVSSEMEFNSNSISDDIGSSDPFSNFENGSDEPRPSTSSGAVGGRSAYKKRERKRVRFMFMS